MCCITFSKSRDEKSFNVTLDEEDEKRFLDSTDLKIVYKFLAGIKANKPKNLRKIHIVCISEIVGASIAWALNNLVCPIESHYFERMYPNATKDTFIMNKVYSIGKKCMFNI